MRSRAVALAGLAVLMSLAAGQQGVPERQPEIAVKEQVPKRDGAGGWEILGRAIWPPVPTGADAFTIHLDAEFALENGPVVYRIRLANRTAEPRECIRHTHDSPVRFTRTPDWIHKPAPNSWSYLITGRYGPYHEQVAGGKNTTELIAVQDGYQRIPPGRVSVEFEWDVVGSGRRTWNDVKRSWGVAEIREHSEHREPVRGRQTVEVLPATPENVARVKEKLDQYLREATARTRPSKELIQCLTGSRHPEFVPLMIRAVQLCEDYECRQLLDTVYDSFPDPTTGFERLFPLLEAGDPASRYLLAYWDLEAIHYRWHQHELATLANLKAGHREVHNGRDVTAFSWDRLENALQLWNYSRTHSNSRLTLGQHARIQALENVWVRALYWHFFPECCSPLWVLRLYADLKRSILPLDNKTAETVCQGLVHDRHAVRERATADAIKMGERVVPALRDYLKRHPSAELEQRIGSIARHFEQQPVPPLAARVIESAIYGGQFQGELIFQALSGPAGSCRLADHVREKRPEQQKRRQEEVNRKREAERLQQAR
jgi:hypothetical protein